MRQNHHTFTKNTDASQDLSILLSVSHTENTSHSVPKITSRKGAPKQCNLLTKGSAVQASLSVDTVAESTVLYIHYGKMYLHK